MANALARRPVQRNPVYCIAVALKIIFPQNGGAAGTLVHVGPRCTRPGLEPPGWGGLELPIAPPVQNADAAFKLQQLHHAIAQIPASSSHRGWRG
ncbi:hypothetical protein IscW_ISCW012346 [Ixodes scapularis]|uniref:Uncharacterized protein n=1 Tax=Ixodes scapularis TaxID=6945 RepID=B7QE51_IXOSC|nr:hypothetical protein IscW_ISCW012346 [Ixodes scapularis]|eukprot:XP_002413815.1 hypothetical protein IscW_ISCW012346 [Ixodes scapularis]